MTADSIKRGAVTFVQMRHDAWCRAQYTQRLGDCCCAPDVVIVDQPTWLAGVERANRAQRRAAERAARRASK